MADTPREIDVICYEQNFAQLRSLNSQMNQVPVLAMTLTGGLWFGAGVTEKLDVEVRFALLMFAGLCNIALVLAVLRIRDVFESYLEKIKELHPAGFVTGRPAKPQVPWLGSYSMISIYSALMLTAAVFSFIGACWKYWPFPSLPAWSGLAAVALLLAGLYAKLFTRGGAVTPTGGG